MRSRKRYCRACGNKWTAGSSGFVREFLETNFFLLVAVSTVLYLSVQVYTGAWKPKEDLKAIFQLPARARRLRRR